MRDAKKSTKPQSCDNCWFHIQCPWVCKPKPEDNGATCLDWKPRNA